MLDIKGDFMRISKYLILFLLFISFIVYVFIRVDGGSPSRYRLRTDDIQNEIDDPLGEDVDVDILPSNIHNGYVAKPIISLDSDIDNHLNLFRKNIMELAKLYNSTYITCRPNAKSQVALTFDDGPDETFTPIIMDILDDYGITCTFFFIGENIQRYPDILIRAQKSGHQVANHSLSHKRPTEISKHELIYEFESCNLILEEHSGEGTRFIRAPYGLLTIDQMELIEQSNLLAIGWSIDSMDWYTDKKDEIVESVLNPIHSGAIILMHSAGGNRQATLEALPTIIESLLQEGYTFTTVENLLKD